jgi:CBS domain-containing protein
MRINDMPEFQDKKNVLTYDVSASLCDAVDAMAKANYGAVLVTRGGKLAGIFTERDLLRKVAACRLDLVGLKLSDVMTSDLKTANINDDVVDCMRRMSHGRFRHLPVVDDAGNLVGLLSQGDFVAFTMSDLVGRFSTIARANVSIGNATPISILLAVFVYTLALLFLLSGVVHWLG